MDFSNKVVLVTGASSGIGAAAAKLFAKYGAHLSLTGRNKEALENIATECKAFHGKEPLLTTGDLTDAEHVPFLMSETKRRFGKLDILVNNAGILELGSIENPEVLDQFDRIFSVNVRPILLLTSLAIPHLIETRGCIVNVSSIAGLRSLPGILAYSLSKSCLDQMTRCTAMELAPKQVRVNCVNPGTIATQIQSRAGVDPRPYYDKAKLTHPLGRIGKPEEVANVIVFLASEMASFMTGVCVPVDGGRHCTTPSTIGSSAAFQKGAGEGENIKTQISAEKTAEALTAMTVETLIDESAATLTDKTTETLTEKTTATVTDKSAETLTEKTTATLTEKTAATLTGKTAETLTQITTESTIETTAETLTEKTEDTVTTYTAGDTLTGGSLADTTEQSLPGKSAEGLSENAGKEK